MKMGKFKNYILFSLIILSQLHTVLRGCEVDIVWVLNGVKKTPSLATFLFVKHLSAFVLVYYSLKPNGVSKNLLIFFCIVTFLDVIHFIILSGFGFELEKIMLSLVIFAATKSKYNKWLN